jgi:hypothetical protein
LPPSSQCRNRHAAALEFQGASHGEAGSSIIGAHQGIQHATKRVPVNITIDPDAMFAAELDLGDAVVLATPRRCRQR